MEPKIKDKSWNPAVEQIIRKKWEETDIYKFSIKKDKEAFVIDTPPPYPSGRPWHIGAAAHYVQIDMIARTARMMGYNVMFPLGIDRNGLPVEIYTEKKYKVRMRQMDREKFLDLCRVALDDLEAEMIQIMKNMGLSGNFEEYYRTDSDEFRALTQSTFIELWNRELVYLANRPNNYCPDCGTTIADAEIIYEDIPTKLIYMNFKVRETNENIIIASTRPELLFACQSVIVNPEDERYLGLQGKHVILPLFDREVEILPHHSAKPEFGSGAVMVCSYGDQNDVQIFRELGLKEIVALNSNGVTTSAAGPYSNLRVNQARIRIIEDLKNAGLLLKEENIIHRTPLCERSKTPIEIIPLQDYFVKQLNFIPKLKELTMKIKFHPETHKQILLNWIDSSITPLFITKYKRDQELYKYSYPTKIRPQAKDIVRTWLYYTMLRCYQLTGQLAWSDAWIMGYGVDEKGEKMSKSKGNVIDPFPIIHRYGADTFRFWSASEANLGHDFRCSEQRILSSQKFLSKLWNLGRFLSSFDFISEAPHELSASDKWILAELSNLVEECEKGYEDFNFFIPANAIREFTWGLFASHYVEMVKGRVYDINDSVGQKSAIFTLHKCLSTILKLLAPLCPFITEELWTKIYSTQSIHLQCLPQAQKYHLEMRKSTQYITEFNSQVWNKKKQTISRKTGKPLSLKDSIDVAVPIELDAFKKDLCIMHNLRT